MRGSVLCVLVVNGWVKRSGVGGGGRTSGRVSMDEGLLEHQRFFGRTAGWLLFPLCHRLISSSTAAEHALHLEIVVM